MSIIFNRNTLLLARKSSSLRLKSSHSVTTSWITQQNTSPEGSHFKRMIQKAGPDSLVVHKLPWKASKEDVKEYFSQFGEVEKIVFPFDANGFPHKCAEIAFFDKSCVSEVAQKSAHHICNTAVAIRYPNGIRPKERKSGFLHHEV